MSTSLDEVKSSYKNSLSLVFVKASNICSVSPSAPLEELCELVSYCRKVFGGSRRLLLPSTFGMLWPCGVVVARLPHTQEDPGSTPGQGSYLRQVSLH